MAPDEAARPGPVVAFQGERGAYGDLAIDARWGEDAPRLPCRDFAGVLMAVEDGRVGAGLLPVHNVIIGAIPGVAEAIARSGVAVVAEITIPVRHCLLAAHGAAIAQLRDVASHPAALAQCAHFFADHPWLVPRESYDTAGAARDVAVRGRSDEGAIANAGCAARYGLSVLRHDIGDRTDNATRFAVVMREARRA